MSDGFSRKNKTWVKRAEGFLISHAIAIVACVGFPALVTAIAPVSWVRFERRDDRVVATARICLLFVVPYRTLTVDPVTGIGDRIHSGSYSRERRSSGVQTTKSEDEGFLVIQGAEAAAEVPVSPVNLKSVVARSEEFLKDPQAGELRMFVVANWKFSVFAGGLISLLTVLYLGAAIFSLFVWLVHLVQKALGVPPPDRWLVRYMSRA